MLGSLQMTVEEGRERQQGQVNHYLAILQTDELRADFQRRVDALNAKVVNPVTGYDIPRGTDIEREYFRTMGLSDQEHAEFCASLD